MCVANLYKSGGQAAVNMPLDVAMVKPDSRVVGAESHDDVSVGADDPCIPFHGDGWQCCIRWIVVIAILLAADHALEIVAVEMEGVFTWVVVVEDDFDDFVMLENEGVGIDAIDCWVAGLRACC